MKRLLIAAAAAATLTLGSVSAASAGPSSLERVLFDQDCDGKHDITGEPMTGRANGVCGG